MQECFHVEILQSRLDSQLLDNMQLVSPYIIIYLFFCPCKNTLLFSVISRTRVIVYLRVSSLIFVKRLFFLNKFFLVRVVVKVGLNPAYCDLLHL